LPVSAKVLLTVTADAPARVNVPFAVSVARVRPRSARLPALVSTIANRPLPAFANALCPTATSRRFAAAPRAELARAPARNHEMLTLPACGAANVTVAPPERVSKAIFASLPDGASAFFNSAAIRETLTLCVLDASTPAPAGGENAASGCGAVGPPPEPTGGPAAAPGRDASIAGSAGVRPIPVPPAFVANTSQRIARPRSALVSEYNADGPCCRTCPFALLTNAYVYVGPPLQIPGSHVSDCRLR
jgi:hypothetical protein